MKVLIKLLIVCSVPTIALGGIIDDINKNKQSLLDAKNQVINAKATLAKNYSDLQSGTIKQLNDALIQVKSQSDTLQKNINQIKGIPSAVLELALIDDLPSTLNEIQNGPIATINNTLQPLDNDLTTISADMNPTTDPKGIYKDFDDAINSFDQAIKNIDDLI